jgi:hypothetical protein
LGNRTYQNLKQPRFSFLPTSFLFTFLFFSDFYFFSFLRLF